MKGVTTNGAKRASSIIDKIKLVATYTSNNHITITPENGKYDSCFIWLHDVG